MFGPEGQAWLDNLGPWQTATVPGLSPDYPNVSCNRDDVCVMTTGMGMRMLRRPSWHWPSPTCLICGTRISWSQGSQGLIRLAARLVRRHSMMRRMAPCLRPARPPPHKSTPGTRDAACFPRPNESSCVRWRQPSSAISWKTYVSGFRVTTSTECMEPLTVPRRVTAVLRNVWAKERLPRSRCCSIAVRSGAHREGFQPHHNLADYRTDDVQLLYGGLQPQPHDRYNGKCGQRRGGRCASIGHAKSGCGELPCYRGQ